MPNSPTPVTHEMADRSSVAIDAQHIAKDFGGPPVLNDLSLKVHGGEIFGLIGPSGSGKTTTIHLCCGHLRPTSGRLTVLSEQPTTFTTQTRRRIGYMPQNFILYPDLTVKQNVAFAAGLYGLGEWRHRKQIRGVLDLVELWPARNRTARAISGGMQRRLALAAALVHAPELLFADEPTANLDPILRAKLWRHFRAMARQGRTLVLTTQYIDEAEHCDRVGLMFDGVLIAEGGPAALRHQAFDGDLVDVILAQPALLFVEPLKACPDVRAVEARDKHAVRLTVPHAASAIPQLLDVLEATDATVRSITEARPTFDEVFIRLIEQHGGRRPPTGRLQTSAVGDR